MSENHQHAIGILRSIKLLAGLEPPLQDALAACASVVQLPAGEVLFREGEPGGAVYAVIEGAVQIWVERAQAAPLVLSRLGPGDLFGEQYLLGGQAGLRNAGARALTDCRLLEIDSARFAEVLEQDSRLFRDIQARRNWVRRENLARRSAVFRQLQEARMADPAQFIRLPEGTVIFREGDAADAAYLISNGTVSIFQGNEPNAPIAQLVAGQCFGEMACINDAPRSASAVATSEVKLVAIPKAAFVQLYAQSREVRELVDGLQFLYQLPNRGVALLYYGNQAGEGSVERLYQLDDGRRFLTSYLPVQSIFRLQSLSAEGEGRAFEWAGGEGRVRAMRVDVDGRVLSLQAVGPWPELPEVLHAIIEGAVFDVAELARFRETGTLGDQLATPASHEGLACYCMQVSTERVAALCAQGCKTLTDIKAKTGCGSVCGGCDTHVLELLGKAEWIPVRLEATERSADVKSFTIKPRRPVPLAWQTGQHLVISGRIEGHWVTRKYTIISPPGAELIEIAVKRETQGLFSRWLFEGTLRDKALRIGHPAGEAIWSGGAAPLVCFVAGIGVTPALAVARHWVQRVGTEGKPGALHIEYSGAAASDMPFLDELQACAQHHAGFSLGVRTANPPDKLTPARIEALAASLPQARYVVCGPPDYMQLVARTLAACGVRPEHIRLEVFDHAGAPLAAP